jgi:acetyl/propionyl-CoA carboxylase alpha subunit
VNYEFQNGDESTAVQLERDGSGYKAVIGDEIITFQADRLSPGSYLLLLGNRSVPVHAVKGDGVWHLSLGGRAFDLKLPGAEESGGDSGDEGPKLVDGVLQTPMPGRVVSVEVKQGDRVEAGQVLAILESMKMQNSIISPVNGLIVKVHKEAGELASFGEPLVELEEEESDGDA